MAMMVEEKDDIHYEGKVVRFSDKNRHQVFIEPEGLYTNEMYVGGMSKMSRKNLLIQKKKLSKKANKR